MASHDTPAIWTLEALEAMQVECFADDVPFKVEHLSRLSRDEVLRYFESGGQQPGQQPEDRVFDVAIVGGGVLGISVARDLAACQLSSIVVEKSTRIGGVWQINEYPGLRLHSPNGAVRYPPPNTAETLFRSWPCLAGLTARCACAVAAA